MQHIFIETLRVLILVLRAQISMVVYTVYRMDVLAMEVTSEQSVCPLGERTVLLLHQL